MTKIPKTRRKKQIKSSPKKTKGKSPKRPKKATDNKRKKSPTPKKATDNKRKKKPVNGKPTMGRPRTLTPEESGRRRRMRASIYGKKIDNEARDIGKDGQWKELIANIDWTRRLACKRDLKLFNETYLDKVFYLGWSTDQLECIRKTEIVFLDGGMFAVAMPRGGGKTAIVRGGIIWGSAYAHRTFPFFIGSTQPKAVQTLAAIKTFWYRSQTLRQDFPEIAYPVFRLENRFHLARGQLFKGESTHIDWGSDSIRFPCLLLPKEDADKYLKHDEDSLTYLDEFDSWIPKSAGVLIGTSGIDGSIRGESETHPILLTQPRPDLVLLDDIQKDQKADSPAACDKIIRLVDGAVQGLAGPGEHIAALMPCTVIREGDAADTYLDRLKKPDWKGQRCSMVIKWPDGINNQQIGMTSKPGKLWNEYDEQRRKSLRIHEDIRLATKFYKRHRKAMDKGFVISWEDRFTRKHNNKHYIELSAQQHAMNLRLRSPETFPSEFQNQGRKLIKEGEVMITSGQLAEKITSIDRRSLPVDVQHLAGFLDIQNEGLFFAVLGLAPDFSGVVADYGTFPFIKTRYFTKGQMEGWGLLTRDFFKKYPEHKDKAIRTESGKVRAPLEAKIYHALSNAVPWLLNLEFVKQDQHQTIMKIQRLGIDTRWGQASDCIKQYIREAGFQNVVPYYGQSFPPTRKQLEEYELTKGWFFEHQAHPQIREAKWVIRPNPDGMFYLAADVNRLKDFLFARLASPPGSLGSISLFNAPPEQHEMFADHVCSSEYPEPVTARGVTKNQWTTREGRPDNDWLDCLVGCCAIGSALGACLVSNQDGTATKTPRRKISSRWKRGGR